MTLSFQWRHALLALFALGVLLRLPNLDAPREIVFDEIYFGKFSTAYCCSFESIFDIHPPHGKLLIAASAKLFGHEAGFDYKGIGEAFTPEVAVFGLRLVPALAGALIPCLAAMLAVQLGAPLFAAFFCGFLLTWDSALWIQSRIIAIDPILIAAILTSLICSLRALRCEDMRKRSRWILAAGVATGFAVGSKFTGLACIPLIGALMLWNALQSKHPRRFLILLRETLWFSVGFAVIYLSGWWLHFYLLDKPGPGDAFYRTTGSFFIDVVELHKVMFEKNAGITASHPYASMWYTWPIMKRPIFYWSQAERFIYFIGNPVVWYGVLIAFLWSIGVWLEEAGKSVLRRKFAAVINIPGTWALAAVVVCFAPLMRVLRPLFLYHYLPTLIFMTIFSCTILANVGPQLNIAKFKYRHHLYVGACILVVVGFIAMLPFTGMTTMAMGYRDWVFAHVPTWR